MLPGKNSQPWYWHSSIEFNYSLLTVHSRGADDVKHDTEHSGNLVHVSSKWMPPFSNRLVVLELPDLAVTAR